MAPIRRYLRISAYSVLEVRIYLDNPADAYRWLLRPRDPVLPRVIEAVRPYVLPKLREENERAKKGSKRKGVKDVVSQDDFEVSIFLTELSTPHSILTRNKNFASRNQQGLSGSRDVPLQIPDEEDIQIIREESDEGKNQLSDLPPAESLTEREERTSDAVSISDDSDTGSRNDPTSTDDKKKFGINTTYDGFQIYGRILCLVIKRKDNIRGKQLPGGQAMMEDWIASTQDGGGAAGE